MYIYLTHRCALRPAPLFLQRTLSTLRHASPPASLRGGFVPDTTSAPWWSGVCLEHQQKHVKNLLLQIMSEIESLGRTVVIELNSIMIAAIIDARLWLNMAPSKQVAFFSTFVDVRRNSLDVPQSPLCKPDVERVGRCCTCM